eukprot:jgi/Hompol1/2645/HPOL_006095-RA
MDQPEQSPPPPQQQQQQPTSPFAQQDSGATLANSSTQCTLYTRFRLKGGYVNIVRDTDGSEHLPSRPGVRVILLGTEEHLIAVTERLVELQTEVAKASSSQPSNPAQAAAKERLLEKLRDEISQRSAELVFLRANITKPDNYDDDDDDEGSSSDPSKADISSMESTLNDAKSNSGSVADSDEKGESLHVTSDTFGKLQKLRTFEIKHKERLFRKPKLRQYFLGDTLYRSAEELKTSYGELFLDLLYVAVISKAGSLVSTGRTWEAFGNFSLVILPVLQLWRAITFYNNSIFHEDLYHKAIALLAN